MMLLQQMNRLEKIKPRQHEKASGALDEDQRLIRINVFNHKNFDFEGQKSNSKLLTREEFVRRLNNVDLDKINYEISSRNNTNKSKNQEANGD
ncbi:hypothetical protein XM38_004230 [Halomicronema hongdechloris C2206]|uniref:Uncharacterized protein n=1 Tax=Halomicronema hongdechloris C2206 TaxID=1641165 RepID=A0A1Z3HGS8_9CYAN|nr:hypothetical protein XM38_004230 [Halomicronema hongdechloris C2206]